MTAVQKFIKDTWQFPVRLYTDTAQTQPKDMTGYTLLGEFYLATDSSPLALTVGSGITVLDYATASYVYEVDPLQYAGVSPMDPTKVTATTKYPTRLRVYDVSPSGIITTRGVILILPKAI